MEKNLERKTKSTDCSTLFKLGVFLGKGITPYIGDKMMHQMCSKIRKDIKNEKLEGPIWFPTSLEISFYGAKYYALYGLLIKPFLK